MKSAHIPVRSFQNVKFLKEVDTIILYGISLDPLDAELSLLLSGTFSMNEVIKKIIIVNPEFEKIRKRVKMLLYPRKDVGVWCFRPGDLEVEI